MDLFYKEMLPRFKEAGIIPVIAMENADDAGKLADALYEGGLRAAEVTFRTAAGPKVLSGMRKRHPDMLVGAGTVRTVAEAEEALECGAEFIVSPGVVPEVISFCIGRKRPVCAGAVTPTEIERVLGFGLSAVKFFPAEPMGGLAAIRALSGPYGDVMLMPTGGINPENAENYLRCDRVFAVGGSWMVPPALLSEGEFGKITALASEAAMILRKARG